MCPGPEEGASEIAALADKVVAIMGLGLMGGSLGLALASRSACKAVCGYARREETRKLAIEMGSVNSVFADPAEAVAQADIVVFCTPVLSTIALANQCCSRLNSDVLVTDVGSTKAQLAAELGSMPGTFIGSHPIAGSERTGLEAATTELYVDSVVVITPSAGTPDHQVSLLEELWRSVGARTLAMDVARHDALLARTSHMPHLLAAMLVDYVADGGDQVGELCGTGFRDTTRVADGSPAVWHDVVASNAEAIGDDLRAFRAVLDKVCDMFDRKDFEGIRVFLEGSRDKRRSLLDHE